MQFRYFENLFCLDLLAMTLISLVSIIGIIIFSFSREYMKGDSHYHKFLRNLGLLVSLIIIMAVSDNILLFLIAWTGINWTLVKLIIHKPEWVAAKISGKLAAINLFLGSFSLGAGFGILYAITGETSIQAILHHANASEYISISLLLILIAVMTQSAIWPFHRWLISSLNCPTPVSAIMHAGVVNGGGFLLVRFSPLYLSIPNLLDIIFIAGIISAFLGSLWKLMQHDVKRMLACSTLGQMGFMLAQCGLGLFPAAIAHLYCHALFKSYLFIRSGSAAQEKRLDLGYPPRMLRFLLCVACGGLGAFSFALVNSPNYFSLDSRLIVLVLVWVSGVQFSLPILRNADFIKTMLGVMLTVIIGATYGGIVYLVESAFASLQLMQPQPLNFLHISSIALFASAWLCVLFFGYSGRVKKLPIFVLKGYVSALNASQPHAGTITTHRKAYKYS